MGRGRSKTGGSVGALGTGVSITIRGITHVFLVTKTGLVDVSGGGLRKPPQGMTTKSMVESMVNNGGATFMNKSAIEDFRKRRQKERAERPDYEMGVNGQRGKGKTIYRPKRAERNLSNWRR